RAAGRVSFASGSRRVLFGDRSGAGVFVRSERAGLSGHDLHCDVDSIREVCERGCVRVGCGKKGIWGNRATSPLVDNFGNPAGAMAAISRGSWGLFATRVKFATPLAVAIFFLSSLASR